MRLDIMHGSPDSDVSNAGAPNDIDIVNTKGPPPSEADVTGKQKLRSWLNKNLKIEMTDGRVLVGVFLCTDRDGNVILGSCSEYLKPEDSGSMEEPRVLGLVMVPGRHVVSIHLDDMPSYSTDIM